MRPLAKTPRGMGQCPDCGRMGAFHAPDCRKIRTGKQVAHLKQVLKGKA